MLDGQPLGEYPEFGYCGVDYLGQPIPSLPIELAWRDYNRWYNVYGPHR